MSDFWFEAWRAGLKGLACLWVALILTAILQESAPLQNPGNVWVMTALALWVLAPRVRDRQP